MDLYLWPDAIPRYDDPFIWAAANGHAGVVDLLLTAGADVRIVGDEAIQNAAINGHADVVKLLLAAGARLEVRRILL